MLLTTNSFIDAEYLDCGMKNPLKKKWQEGRDYFLIEP